MRNTNAKVIALGGLLAAAALVILCLGGMIPLATYICPMLCAIVQYIVYRCCGRRIAWGWYAAVSILSLLMAPDKEAAAVFLALGYYPILKPGLDRRKGKWLWKLLFFNAVILLTYWLLMHLFGMDQIIAEFSEMGAVMTAVLLVLGNVTFFMLDRLLGMRFVRRR